MVRSRRHHPRGFLLLAQERDEVVGGALVEVVRLGQLLRVAVHGPARELADRAAELGGPADAVAAPERHRTGNARRGRHDHAVARDLLDPPGGRAEQEGGAGPRLVDHFLVELAHAPAVRQVHAVEAAVGNGSGVRDRELARALAGADGVVHAVPHDARPQLGELLRRVAPVEHVEHLVEQLARQVGVGVGALHQLVHGRHRQLLLHRRHRHDLLGEHVERVAPDHRLLDEAVAHALGHHGALEQVGPELGEDAALGRVAHVVARPADALQPARDRLGRLHLQHEVHGAHVDAQLERRGGHEAGQLAGLQHLLHHGALLARERAVVGAGDLHVLVLALGRQLVQPHGQPLGAAAAVHEQDRAAVLLHQLEQVGVDGRPDRAPCGVAAAVERVEVGGGLRLHHALHRHADLEVERLADAGVDDRALAGGADQELGHLLERPLGGGEADALRRLARADVVEALQRERQVGAALGLRHRVDLVHDHPLGAAQDLARPRGEHQVERLGRGDEHVGRLAQHLLALALGRVTGADGHVNSPPIPFSGARRLRSTS